MSDTFYKPTNNTTTVRHLFTANDARKVMEDLGLEVKENLQTVFSYGYWHNDALRRKEAIILRWSPFSGFLLYEPVKTSVTILPADNKIKHVPGIIFCADDKTSEKILPIIDSDWHEQLVKWFNDTKKRVFALAAEIHNEEVEEVLNEL
jgi:hypothetical protein